MTTARASTCLLALAAAFAGAGCSRDRSPRSGAAPRADARAAAPVTTGTAGASPSAGDVMRAREAALATELARVRGDLARTTHLCTSLSQDLDDLRAEFAETRRRLLEKEALIAAAEGSGVDFSPPSPPAPPAIDGAVVAVLPGSYPVVVLSVGADDRVEFGYQFSIYRGTQFVGKVLAERVLRDSTGCRVMFVADDQEIRSGDAAATRLQ